MNFAEQRLFRTNGEWNRQRIKHHVKGFFGGGTPSTENREFWTNGIIPWVSSKDMKAFRVRETQDYITAAAVASSATNLVEPGSVLMVVRSGILKHSIPVAINDVEVALNQDIKAFVLRETLNPEFFLYWVTGQQRDLLLEWGQLGATVDSLNTEILRNTVIPLPSLDYQRTIVSFLDLETSRIDGLIEKKTQFIALLKEKRAAVITHAVTKGIDPDAPMKDSGVDWLGRVPAHWEVLRIAAMFREVSRPADPGLPVLSVSIHDGITDGELADEDRNRKVALSEDRTKYQGVAPGDLVYNMMRAWQGAFGAVTVKGLVSPAYVVAAPVTTFRTKFIEHLLHTKSAAEEIRRFSRGIADFRMRLYWDHFRALKVCLPPLDEQDRILSEIDAETARIDGLIALTERSIDLLREKRSALITAAVTGKIDVRAAA